MTRGFAGTARRRGSARVDGSSARKRLGVVAAMIAAVTTTIPGIGQTETQEGKAMSFSITSTAFAPNGAIPVLYTCKGKDISPPLAWTGVPAGAKSLALIVDDPDAPDPAAPKMTWVHWVLYDIPATRCGARRGCQARGVSRGNAGRDERLRPHRLRRSVPADRPPPVLLQALRARHGPARPSGTRPRRRSRRRCRATSSRRQRSSARTRPHDERRPVSGRPAAGLRIGTCR